MGDAARARYAKRRAAGRCVDCGMKLIGDEAKRCRCEWCVRRARLQYLHRPKEANEAKAARDHARRRELQATEEGRALLARYALTARTNRKLRAVCLECGLPPAPRRERCYRHLQRARKRARVRRAAERAARSAP